MRISFILYLVLPVFVGFYPTYALGYTIFTVEFWAIALPMHLAYFLGINNNNFR